LRGLASATGHGTALDEAGCVLRTWVIVLVTVIACAGFAARSVASIVEANYLAPNPIGVAPHAPVKAASPARRAPDDANLVTRNMFCSTCAPSGPGGGGGGDAFSGKEAVLIATSIGGEPRATVRVPETEVQGSWGLGDVIPGVGTIDHIGPASIDVVDPAGHHAKLSLLDAAVAANRREDRSAATPDPSPFAERIKKVDDHTYEVDRELVRELVSGVTKAGGVRMLPIVKDGNVQGVRVFGVTSSSVAGAIGLKSGDQIVAIDNDPIKNAQQLLDLLAKLDKIDNVELQGTRAGKPLAISLRLR
jgi:hypothetical protein